MSWYKKIFSGIIILLIFGTHPVSMANHYTILLPLNEKTAEEETASKLTDIDASENNAFLFIYSLTHSVKDFFIIACYLPITFYLI
ncbi:MAG: hypothetical protein KAR45_02305, partial [Desulfobacteraceae bacterium]|nr:hypothetical protein [Desulfobacteraceae bacterium]